MDHSSLASITPGTPAASASTSTQPTYTTAGTIYNPGSSQPLQPPARRGRSFKWAPVGPHSDLGLIPRSVLAALPLKPGSGGRLPITASFQQYTPLQQNYDRAVSPVSDPDHEVVRMPLQAPRLRPIHNLASVPSFPLLDPPKIIDTDTDEDDDDDNDFGINPLMNMTVKSLHNLASYPNPNQKRAQKALLRGAKPNLGNLAAASRMNAPPVYPTFGSFEPSKDVGDRPFGLLRHTMSESSGLQRSAVESRSNLFDFGRASTYIPGEFRLPSPAPTSDAAEIAPSILTTLASGPGAPRPLTAGPPGQRQYRPSTFESTFKALHTKSRPQSHTFDDSEALAITQHTLLQAGIEDVALSSDPFLPQSRLTPQPYSDFAGNASALMTSFERDDMSSSETQRDELAAGTAESVYTSLYNDMAAQSILNWQSELRQKSWHLFSSCTQVRFQPGTDRLADEEIEARNRRINRQWYAGTGAFGSIEEHVTVVDHQPRSRKNIYGAVGEGRPTKNDQSDVHKDQAESGISRTQQVDQAPSSGNARLPVNVAFTSVLRNAEDESSCPKLSPTLWPCDKEAGHRLSFFGNTFQRIN